MSNALSVAAVTRTLRNLLDAVTIVDFSGLPADTRPAAQIEVTCLPLDRVRLPDASRNRLNLFLYQAEPNAAWRNTEVPRRSRPGEAGIPPLGLTLRYLLSAFGENDSELIAQVLLGTGMRILHDHPVLAREEIRDALAQSGLDAQVERVRVTPLPLSLDELSRLWTGFQAAYRLSVAFEVSVVLIESERAARAALPVLRRGSEDRGVAVLAAPAPTLTEVRRFLDPALTGRAGEMKPAAELGDTVVLVGRNFGSEPLVARFVHPLADGPIVRPIEGVASETEVHVALPGPGEAGVPAAWPAGIWTVELEVQRATPPRWTTNRLAFGLVPTITAIGPVSQPVGAQPFDLTVACVPQIRPEQRVGLLLGAHEIRPVSVTTPASPDGETTLVFPIEGLPEGSHVVRLRVDGIDSIPVDFTGDLPAFDPDQTVLITP